MVRFFQCDQCTECACNWAKVCDEDTVSHTNHVERYQQQIIQSHRCIKKLYNFILFLCFYFHKTPTLIFIGLQNTPDIVFARMKKKKQVFIFVDGYKTQKKIVVSLNY